MLDCYYMDVCSDCSNEQSLALYEMLSPDRKRKVDRLKKPDMAKKQILTGAFLQYILSKHSGIPVRQIEFDYNDNDKPSLKNASVHFNLSHSGQYAVIAVSDHNVGIDIERKKAGRISVAKRCFCTEEYEDIISAGDEEEVALRFLEYWTLKEAYVKYIGKGLSMPFHSFLIKRCFPNEYSVLDDNAECVPQMYTFPFYDEYRISVCCESGCGSDMAEPIMSSEIVKKIKLTDILE